MADICPTCLREKASSHDDMAGPRCGVDLRPVEQWRRTECLHVAIRQRDTALATTKAQLDRALLLLVKARDALDLAIGDCQQKVESNA